MSVTPEKGGLVQHKMDSVGSLFLFLRFVCLFFILFRVCVCVWLVFICFFKK